jgi:hypothetical protein
VHPTACVMSMQSGEAEASEIGLVCVQLFHQNINERKSYEYAVAAYLF